MGKRFCSRVSPDGKRIAFCTEEGKAAFIWIYDLSGTSSMRKLTFVGANRYPVWSADSQRVLFQSDREGDLGIFWQRADGTGNAERLAKPENGIAHIPDSASSDGRHFSYTTVKGDERAVWIFSIPDKKATLFASAPDSRLGSSAFSPDGKWLAYHSDETKRYQVFVQPFPADGTKYLVSRDAQSHNPLWSPDGKEMFYIPGPNQFVKISIATKPAFTFGDPVETPKGNFIEYGPPGPRTYDITPDGKRFLGVVIANQLQNGIPVTPPIQVILNWFSELQQRVPVK